MVITKKLFDTIKQELSETFSTYFKYGKLQEEFESRQEQERQEQERIEELKRKWQNLSLSEGLLTPLARLLLRSSQYEVKRRISEFDPNNPKIKFNSEQDAKDFVGRINQQINLFTNDAKQKLVKITRQLSKDLEQKIPKVIVKSVGDILDEAQQKLNRDGFEVNFSIPEPNIEQNEIDFSSLVLASIEDKTKTIVSSETRKTEGFLEGIVPRGAGFVVKKVTFGFLQPDWGYEEVEVSKTKSLYIVDMKKLQENLLKDLDNRILNLGFSNHNFFKTAVKPIIDNYFNNLKSYLQEFRGTMMDSINYHRLSEQDAQKLIRQSIDIKKKISSHNNDVENLKKRLKEAT